MIALEEIKQLMDLVTQGGISALDVTKGDTRVRIEAAGAAARAMPVAVEGAGLERPTPPRAPKSPKTPDAAAKATVAAAPKVVRAPTDGIVHLSPSPGAPAFVSVGQAVQAGDTVCVIEVMKMFFPVAAGVAGTIEAIAVASGQQVAFDEVLCALA